MDFQKVLNNYIKEKSKNPPDVVVAAKAALKKSGHNEFQVILTDDDKFVLLNMNKDVSPGVILRDNVIVDFKNTEDFEAVTVNAYARYNVLKNVSSGEDLRDLKELFKKRRTWIIHFLENENGFVEAHTHGLDSYSHPDFRVKNDIGKEEVAYLLNSLCKSIQRGNAFRDGDTIENLYENCNVLLKKADDGMFDVSFVEVSTIR